MKEKLILFIIFKMIIIGCERSSTRNDFACKEKIKQKDSTILLLNDALDLCEEENQILGSALAEKNGN